MANVSFGLFSLPNQASSAIDQGWKQKNAGASAASKMQLTSLDIQSRQTGSAEISTLASALQKSEAVSAVFSKLDQNTRTKLEGFVTSGKISADDVVAGLRGLLKQKVIGEGNSFLPEKDVSELKEAQKNYLNSEKVTHEHGAIINQSMISFQSSLSTSREQFAKPHTNSDGDFDLQTFLSNEDHEADLAEFREGRQAISSSFEKATTDWKSKILEEFGLEEGVDYKKIYSDLSFAAQKKSERALRDMGLFDRDADKDLFSESDQKAAQKLMKLGLYDIDNLSIVTNALIDTAKAMHDWTDAPPDGFIHSSKLRESDKTEAGNLNLAPNHHFLSPSSKTATTVIDMMKSIGLGAGVNNWLDQYLGNSVKDRQSDYNDQAQANHQTNKSHPGNLPPDGKGLLV